MQMSLSITSGASLAPNEGRHRALRPKRHGLLPLRGERTTLLTADLRVVTQVRCCRRIVEVREQRQRDVPRAKRGGQAIAAFGGESRAH